MKILTFTTLYPNSCQPRHGIFVKQRLGKLLAGEDVESVVLAPVPWFPWSAEIFGQYGMYARVPYQEQDSNLQIHHPRYISIPKIGMSMAPLLLAGAMRKEIRRIIDSGFDFDLIDAHYYYPDGVAAVMLANELGKPVVVTARGSDLNMFLKYRIPRQWIRWAESRASATITVSGALKDRLIEQGVAGNRVTVLRNGVDLELFSPVDRDAARQRLGIEGRTILSVGHLVGAKGHDIVIEAISRMEGINLVIIGEGEMRERLEKLVAILGLGKRVTIMGNMAQEILREFYGASDALVLASAREGMPNVLLESMACGTPVIATNVGGVPEIVHGPAAGIITDSRSADALVASINRLFSGDIDRAEVRRHAEKFSWHDTTIGQRELFERIVTSRNER